MTPTHDPSGPDYLWDSSAPTDDDVRRDDVRRLERTLSVYRFDARRARLRPDAFAPRPRRRPWLTAAVAAGVLLALVTGAAIHRWTWPEGRGWPMVVRSGESARDAVLEQGATFETGAAESARIQVARIGAIDAAPGTALRLRSTASNRHRLLMTSGAARVRVWAPPFAVHITTPSGDVADLGCAFRLSVSPETGTSVSVESGWVLLSNVHGEVTVPAGASSVMPPGEAPLVPVFDDATEAFRRGSRAVEAASRRGGSAMPSIAFVADARPRDVLTLLLLARIAPEETSAGLIDAAARLSPPPAGLDLSAVAAGDRERLWAWIDRLDLPPAKQWWRHWRDGFR